jgi:anti-sigma regulatory factor (Ser/Thr protein kinase)
LKISVQLPAGAEGAGEARKALDGLARETPKDVLSKLELLVSELVVNSPKHSGQDTADIVLVEVETTKTTIRAEIVDLGTGAATQATPEEDRSTGWDVILLEELSSRWGILESSTDGVWFELDRWTKTGLGPSALRS